MYEQMKACDLMQMIGRIELVKNEVRDKVEEREIMVIHRKDQV